MNDSDQNPVGTGHYVNYVSSTFIGPAVLGASLAVIDAYNTSPQGFAGTSNVTYQAFRQFGNLSFLSFMGNNRVIVNRAGVYRIAFSLTIERQGGGPNPGLAEGRITVDGGIVAGTLAQSSHTLQTYGVQNQSNEAFLDLPAGSDIRIEVERISGNGALRIIDEGAQLVVQRYF